VEEAEGSGGSKYEAPKAVEGSGGEVRGSGGSRRLWWMLKALVAGGKVWREW
jgi:hypothetical protein